MKRVLEVTLVTVLGSGLIPSAAAQASADRHPTAQQIQRFVEFRESCRALDAVLEGAVLELEKDLEAQRAAEETATTKEERAEARDRATDDEKRLAVARAERKRLEMPCSVSPVDLGSKEMDVVRKAAASRLPATEGIGKAGAAPGATAGGEAAGVSWESELLNGLTAFLLDRARAEAVEGFLFTIKEDFCGLTSPLKADLEAAWQKLQGIEARIAASQALEGDRGERRALLEKADGKEVLAARELFPQTCTFLRTFSPGGTTGPFGGAWRSALADDLDSFFEHYFRYREWPGERGAALDVLVGTLQRKLRAIQQGQHPLEALKQLATEEAPYLSTESTCATGPGRAHAVLYNLGLLAAAGLHVEKVEKENRYRFELTTEQIAELLPHAACVDAAKAERIARVSELGAEVVRQVQEARELKGKGLRTDAQVATALLRALQSFVGIARELGGNAQDLETVSRFLSLTGIAVDARIAAADGNYGLLTVKVASFVAELNDALQAGDGGLPESVVRLARFAGDLGSAKTAEEIKSALEAHAAPMGSFRAKRGKTGKKRNLVTSITGFVGVGGGYEWFTGESSGDSDRHGSSRLGLSVPVGIDFAWGVGETHSLSLFASLIDLGAIADYRLKQDDEVSQAPNVGFKQVLSPGLFVTYGFNKKLPLVVGLGAQMSPELRSVASDGTTQLRDRTAIRAGVFLAIDVTLFQF